MAKALGLIGNFTGKLGNAVGYNLKDSNNKQTQGVRVYQPVVKNPRTYAQALQRAKLAPINATYRVLKTIIDRGQQGVAYGNKSRLAWLSAALVSFDKAYFVKGATIDLPALVAISKGSLPNPFAVTNGWDEMAVAWAANLQTAPTTIGAMTEELIKTGRGLQDGDQLTFVMVNKRQGVMDLQVQSVVLDLTSTESIPSFLLATTSSLKYNGVSGYILAGCCVVSREGSNGDHMRSSSVLCYNDAAAEQYGASTTADEAAKSYMSQGANTDWAEESIQ